VNEDHARFAWLPPGARPSVRLPKRQELVFALIGTVMMFSGYDIAVFGLALPQIQHALHIPEDMAGATIAFFRLAAIPAMLVALSADVFGRRRILLITIFGETLFTIATAFSQTYEQFVWLQVLTRVFGYCEELLCFVVIAEEMNAAVRGWSIGMLGAMSAVGAGLAAIAFAAVTILPYHWRALYVIGGAALAVIAYFRRRLPETDRFEMRKKELTALGSRMSATRDALRHLVRDYPGRLIGLIVLLAAFGYAIGPTVSLMSKYLQQTHHYAPHQVTALFLAGGLLSVVGNIAAGRLSDRIGRKIVIFFCMICCGGGYAVFFSGVGGWILPVSWIVALFGYIAADALIAGFAVEIFPTAYRATVSGLRYLTGVLSGAVGLSLEGFWYDHVFHAHGPAIAVALLTIPIALVAILFLPEPARKALEEIAATPA
jgi:MFS family permease